MTKSKNESAGSGTLHPLVSQHEPEVYAFPKGAITEARTGFKPKAIPRTAKRTNGFVQFLKDGLGVG